MNYSEVKDFKILRWFSVVDYYYVAWIYGALDRCGCCVDERYLLIIQEIFYMFYY